MDTENALNSRSSGLPPNLYDYAIEQAKASAQHRQLPTVARESGVDYSWLSKFARGKIPGAGYAMVHQLALYYWKRENGPPQ